MSEHKATVEWKRETAEFTYETYNRDHDWIFDAGVRVRRRPTRPTWGVNRASTPRRHSSPACQAVTC